ncbi:MAG: DUF1553 domain-containing protein [Fuerstiella sp.]
MKRLSSEILIVRRMLPAVLPVVGWALLLSCASSSSAFADDRPTYNRDIRPILAEYCFSCHGPDSASRQADLRLDRREAAIESGALVPGGPDDSEVLVRVLSADPELVMPPAETKKTLTAREKELLKQWIADGAEYQAHWSFIPPTRPALPPVQNAAWPRNEIDAFVLAKLEAEGLSPAPEAEAHRLYRRLHLDITGLLPAPEDVAAFAADYGQRNEQALSEWIDRLMQAPAWGEHRARYWLDAARYADTHGLHFDNYREIWPYRDWVIRAFNANRSFDQFTVEQIAGDLLPNPTSDQLIATGFQRCNITTNEGGTIDEENMALYASDRVQTFGWVYLGMTTNCAQCHDHKFDPFTTRDYYSLAAFFRNTTQPAKDGNTKDGRGPVVVVPALTDRDRWQALPDEIAAAAARRNERRKTARGAFEKWVAAVTAESLEADLPRDGLVAHLPLNEGADQPVVNLTQPANIPGTTGAITWVPDGKLGPAPVIRAGATFELGDTGDFERNQSFSYGAWVRADRDNNGAAVIARMDEQAAYRGWDLWVQGRSFGVHIIDSWPDNALKVVTQQAVLTPGQWQHVFVTYDGSGTPAGVSIYVDGQPQLLKQETNTLRPEASIRTATPLRIGQRSTGQVFDGANIQDVRVYGRQLSAVEVRTLADDAVLRTMIATPADQRTPEQDTALFDHYLQTRDSEYSTLAAAVTQLEAEQQAIRSRSPVTHVQQERMDSPAMAHVLIRGEYDRPGDQVMAATPAALHPMPAGAPNNRLGLAQWVVDPANPLTARVTVNRFWQQIFGQGIVLTAEDFGVMGAEPSHPELLDWLAVEFRESGWDVKRLFKLILMSATYRQAAMMSPEKLEKDRDNRLLSRGPRYRMDAEMIRDAALAASGLLSSRMYGPGVKPYQPVAIWDVVGLPGGDTRNYVPDTGENIYRRSVYTFWKRMAPPPGLEAFNAPSREVCTVRRERTNTPLQALVTLNDPQFVEAARVLAQNALLASDGDAGATVDFIFRRVVSRLPDEAERAVVLSDLAEYLAYYAAASEQARALVSVGESRPDQGLDIGELAAWTMVCNQLLNLDEALNK